MIRPPRPDANPEPHAKTPPNGLTAGSPDVLPVRIESKDLFRKSREVEIAHEGRIYRLRLTQLNKLILTA